jgi:hypothetical protein
MNMQQLSRRFFRKKMHVPANPCTKTMKIVKNCKTLALCAAAALLLTGCGPSTKEMLADVGKAMEANLVKDFAELKFEENSYASGMHPKVLFSGKTSTILVQEKPELWTRTFSADEVHLSGLAITKGGRYFTFTYQAQLVAQDMSFFTRPCVKPDCRFFRYHSSISRKAAMEWFFRSDVFTPERFKELFDEEAPPKQVEA